MTDRHRGAPFELPKERAHTLPIGNTGASVFIKSSKRHSAEAGWNGGLTLDCRLYDAMLNSRDVIHEQKKDLPQAAAV